MEDAFVMRVGLEGDKVASAKSMEEKQLNSNCTLRKGAKPEKQHHVRLKRISCKATEEGPDEARTKT